MNKMMQPLSILFADENLSSYQVFFIFQRKKRHITCLALILHISHISRRHPICQITKHWIHQFGINWRLEYMVFSYTTAKVRIQLTVNISQWGCLCWGVGRILIWSCCVSRWSFAVSVGYHVNTYMWPLVATYLGITRDHRDGFVRKIYAQVWGLPTLLGCIHRIKVFKAPHINKVREHKSKPMVHVTRNRVRIQSEGIQVCKVGKVWEWVPLKVLQVSYLWPWD